MSADTSEARDVKNVVKCWINITDYGSKLKLSLTKKICIDCEKDGLEV